MEAIFTIPPPLLKIQIKIQNRFITRWQYFKPCQGIQHIEISGKLQDLSTYSVFLVQESHCAESVRIRCYSGPNFPAFALNTEKYGVSLRIQSEYGKMRTRIIYTDLFHVVSGVWRLCYTNTEKILTTSSYVLVQMTYHQICHLKN